MSERNFATGRIETKRGHSYKLDNKKVDGVTTIIKGGLPAPALTYWAANTVAQYVVDHFDEVQQAVNLRPDTAYYHLKQTPWEDRDTASNRGTEVHRYAESIVKGEPIGDPPDEIAGHVDSLAQFFIDWQPEFAHLEVIVASREYRYMGTADFLAFIPGIGFVLGDYKTGRSGIYPETALQLAAYRYAEFIVVGAAEVPMPEVDACLAVHVTADGYDLIPITADEETFASFLYVQQVHEFNKRAKLLIGEPLAPPTLEEVTA